MTHPIYAIGDIHGQMTELSRVLDLIERDGGPDAHVVFIGDYTDRGPNSKAVIDTLIEGRDANRNWTFLMGNHDRMFSWFMEDVPRDDPYLPVELSWLHSRLGGDTTLASYGAGFKSRERRSAVHARARDCVPQSHLDFLADLKLSYETDKLFFSHAGIRPGIKLAEQTEHDLLWIRQEFHLDPAAHPKLIVHGHTPVDTATHYGNRINLDTGAGYGEPLTAAVFDNGEVWALTSGSRVPIARSSA